MKTQHTTGPWLAAVTDTTCGGEPAIWEITDKHDGAGQCEKTKVVCRFCGQTHAKRMEGDGYKPVLYSHKCPHGKECFGGQRKGKGQNWSVLVLGGKDVDGCRECYNWQLTTIKLWNC